MDDHHLSYITLEKKKNIDHDPQKNFHPDHIWVKSA